MTNASLSELHDLHTQVGNMIIRIRREYGVDDPDLPLLTALHDRLTIKLSELIGHGINANTVEFKAVTASLKEAQKALKKALKNLEETVEFLDDFAEFVSKVGKLAAAI